MVEKSSNWQEFKHALSYLATPPQNVVFADTAGNIGLITNGKMPIKAKDRQRGVFASSDSLATFRGYLDQSDLPQIYNPEKGFIASANQRQIYNAKHYFNGSNMAPPYRGKSISDNLRSIASATPEDMTRVQADIVDLSAADLLPLLLTEIEGQAIYTAAFEYLKNWNHKMAKDQIAPTIYDQFRKQLFYEFQNRVLKNTEIIPPPDYVVIRELVKNETFNKITRREILLASFDAALRGLSDHFGDDIATWVYGRYHQTEMTHLLRLDAFSEPAFASDGSKYTVNVARGPKVTAGSSQRSVIHMTTPVEAWMNIAGGQSGRPSSRNFKNQIPRWKMVDLRKVEFVDSVGDLKSYVQKISVGDDDE